MQQRGQGWVRNTTQLFSEHLRLVWKSSEQGILIYDSHDSATSLYEFLLLNYICRRIMVLSLERCRFVTICRGRDGRIDTPGDQTCCVLVIVSHVALLLPEEEDGKHRVSKSCSSFLYGCICHPFVFLSLHMCLFVVFCVMRQDRYAM